MEILFWASLSVHYSRSPPSWLLILLLKGAVTGVSVRKYSCAFQLHTKVWRAEMTRGWEVSLGNFRREKNVKNRKQMWKSSISPSVVNITEIHDMLCSCFDMSENFHSEIECGLAKTCLPYQILATGGHTFTNSCKTLTFLCITETNRSYSSS
jgi:hypothetical protein